MRRIKSLLLPMFAWLCASLILWGFVFSIITDTTPDKKLTVAVGAQVTDAKGLALALEKRLPEGIKMAKVYPFNYAVMSSNSVESADIIILPEGAREAFEAFITGEGISCNNALTHYINYIPEGEAYMMCQGAKSVHPEIAKEMIEIMLNMEVDK